MKQRPRVPVGSVPVIGQKKDDEPRHVHESLQRDMVPYTGYAVVEEIDDVKTASGLVLATGLAASPHDPKGPQPPEPFKVHRLIRTSGKFFIQGNLYDHDAKVGDLVIIGPGAPLAQSPLCKTKQRMVNLSHVAGHMVDPEREPVGEA